ncbi:hypothetical protein [Bacillus sp. FJAT-52991]|uniref:Preprotein translocase subunit Tim44 n=1 Tax=Bacillus kandeliae TaxID=3129297 RepID=A0ABZ2N8T4_9BACI
MIKKIMASLLVLSLCFVPVAHMLDQNANVASAKKYNSGKKSYNSNSTNSNSPSTFKKENDKKDSMTTAKKSTATKSNKGGFLKGMMLGGLAGLLFGSLLGNLGVLGSILGFMINTLAIVAIVMIVRKIFTSLKKKRKDDQAWER